MEFRTQPMIEAALREARQEAAQEAPQPERTEQQDAACGMLPACAPLANPFVPFQRDDPPVYAAAVGAVRGTLFPGLDLPLRGQENSGELSGTLQRDLQALGFAVVELGEYRSIRLARLPSIFLICSCSFRTSVPVVSIAMID